MNQNQLEVGDLAPQFKTTDALGKIVDLADYKDKFVLLVFLRYSGCPLCNLTIHRLTLEYPMLAKQGCEVIAFVQSDAANIQANVYDRHKHRPQYSIIPDAGRKIYDEYYIQDTTKIKGVAKLIVDIPYWLKAAFVQGFPQAAIDGDTLLVPATFLVSPDDQKIVKVEYSSSFYEHKTFTSIYEPLIFK